MFGMGTSVSSLEKVTGERPRRRKTGAVGLVIKEVAVKRHPQCCVCRRLVSNGGDPRDADLCRRRALYAADDLEHEARAENQSGQVFAR